MWGIFIKIDSVCRLWSLWVSMLGELNRLTRSCCIFNVGLYEVSGIFIILS